MRIDGPSVTPPNTPDQISGTSSSLRCVTSFDCPGRRRCRSGRRSSAASGNPGGQPSMMTTYPGPWLTPAVVMRNNSPKELPGMFVTPQTPRDEIQCSFYNSALLVAPPSVYVRKDAAI